MMMFGTSFRPLDPLNIKSHALFYMLVEVKMAIFWRFYGYKIAVFANITLKFIIVMTSVEEKYLSYEIGLIQKY